MLYFLFSLSPIGWARESDGNDLLSSFLLFFSLFLFVCSLVSLLASLMPVSFPLLCVVVLSVK